MGEGRRRLDELCRRAFLTWGPDSQHRKLMEECAELIQATAKLWYENDLGHLAEEMCDVELMIHQIKQGHELEAAVEMWKVKKLARLERALERNEPVSRD